MWTETPNRRLLTLLRILLFGCAAVVLAGCAGGTYAPTGSAANKAGWRPPYHTVKAGDTLYSIAWQHGLNYKTVARWNGIGAPYTIYPGQRVRLSAPPVPARQLPPRRQSPPAAKSGVTTRAPAASAKKATPRQSASRSAGSDVKWIWPANGPVIGTFSRDDAWRKGLEIAGRSGDPVHAAAAGRVVYAGSGLRGLGMLVIVKHNNFYLSAYAHNRKLIVRESDYVRAGQKIAEMGSTGTDQVKLHFEIRRDGKPVDPLRYLPPR